MLKNPLNCPYRDLSIFSTIYAMSISLHIKFENMINCSYCVQFSDAGDSGVLQQCFLNGSQQGALWRRRREDEGGGKHAKIKWKKN